MVEYSDNFLKEAKKLSKKFKLVKADLQQAVKDIENTKELGVYLGFSLYKKRIQNSSIPVGKSGGFRIIIYQYFEDRIILMSIYSKTNKDVLKDDELKAILKQYMMNKEQKNKK